MNCTVVIDPVDDCIPDSNCRSCMYVGDNTKFFSLVFVIHNVILYVYKHTVHRHQVGLQVHD